MAERETPATTSLTFMGVLLIVLGALAIATPAVAGKAVVLVIGAVLLFAGIVQIVSGLRSEGWSSKLPPLILGIFSSVCGLGLLGQPWIGMEIIALLLAIFFVVEGVWKIVASFSYRPASGWLLMLASGAVALLLGLIVSMQWPLSSVWVVGILVGVDLLMTGIAMIALATTIRRLRSLAEEAAAL